MFGTINHKNIFICGTNYTNEWKSTVKRALGYSVTVIQFQMHLILMSNI